VTTSGEIDDSTHGTQATDTNRAGGRTVAVVIGHNQQPFALLNGISQNGGCFINVA
jgi:hypothetical protein